MTNISTGNRGAGICEQLLRLGYYVIFLTSVRAVKPFVRHVLPPHPMPHVLDFMSIESGQQQQRQQLQSQLVLQPGEEPVASEGEVIVPPAAATSRRLAETVPHAASVTSVGGVAGGSASLPEEEDAHSTSDSQNDPPISEGLEASSSRGSSWRIVLRDHGSEANEVSSDELEKQVDAFGWSLNTREAEAALEVYKQCRERLLCVTYKTLVEYSFLLRAIVAGAASLRERLMVCSAAAVADFYMPYTHMSQHKLRPPQKQQQQEWGLGTSEPVEGSHAGEGEDIEIQGPSRSSSSTGAHPKRWFTNSNLSGGELKEASQTAATVTVSGAAAALGAKPVPDEQQHHLHLTLRLHVVPKMLLMIRAVAPSCFLVVFKLETEESRLEERALSYVEGSGGQGVADCVIGNTLQTRGVEVTLYTRDGQKEIKYRYKQQPEYLGVSNCRIMEETDVNVFLATISSLNSGVVADVSVDHFHGLLLVSTLTSVVFEAFIVLCVSYLPLVFLLVFSTGR